MADIVSADYFMLDGVSSATVGLFVDSPQVPPMAQQRYTTWETGQDMDFTSANDVFEDISIEVRAYMFNKHDDFDLSEVYAFISGKQSLQTSRFSNRYYKIRQIVGVYPSHSADGRRINLDLQFVCAPFKYHTSNEETTPTNGVIVNPGTRYSRPIYKLTHSGSGCALTVNGQTLTIAAVGQESPASPIWIDAERMFAYDSNGANQTKFTAGPFPFLQPGNNNISTTGTAVTVIGNWRDL